MKQRDLLTTAILSFTAAVMIAACLFATQYAVNQTMPTDYDRAVAAEVGQK